MNKLKETDIEESAALKQREVNQAIFRHNDSRFVQFMQSFAFLALPELALAASASFLASTAAFLLLFAVQPLFADYWEFAQSSVAWTHAALGFAGVGAAFCLSSVADSLGVKYTFMLGLFVSAQGCLIMFLAMNAAAHLALLLALVVPGLVLAFASLMTIVGMLAEEATRRTALALALGSVFASALLALAVVETLLACVTDDESAMLSLLGSAFVVLLLATLLAALLPQESLEGEEEEVKDHMVCSFWAMFGLSRLWKLAGMVFPTSLVQVPFMSSFTLLPVYMDRHLDNAYLWLAYLLTFLLLAVSSVTMTGVAYFTSLYTSLILAGLASAAAPLWLGFAHEYEAVAFFLFAVGLSEALLVPRLAEYAYGLNVLGRQGFLMTTSGVSCLFSLGLSGVATASLLEELCPAHGDESCGTLWLALAGTAGSGTLLLVLFQSAFKHPEQSRFCCGPY